MLAAITARSPSSFIGVKYEDNSKKPYLWKRTRFNGLTTHWTPDRTIYYGSPGPRANAIPTVDLDVVFPISAPTEPEVLVNAGFDYAMASPHHVSAGSETRRNDKVKLFCDSGGFQLISGALDWVDMDELADTYNRTIDYGIGLDIPTPGELQKDFLMRMCDVMIKNNRYLRSKVVPEVEIYDVSHGNTLQLRAKFLDRVLAEKKKERRDGQGLAIGAIAQNFKDGGQRQTVVTGSVNLIYTLLKSKGLYERYHVLGTTNSFFQFLYHVLLHYEVAPHITADSTSYVLPATYNLMIANKLAPDHSLLSLELPKEERSYTLNCNCPVCYHVKYAREYQLMYMTNTLHGMYATANQRDRIEEIAGEYLRGRIGLNEALSVCTGEPASSLKVYTAIVKFAIEAAEKGFKEAWLYHEKTLNGLMRGSVSTGGLFNKGTKAMSSKAKRLDSILTRFEEFHAAKTKGRK